MFRRLLGLAPGPETLIVQALYGEIVAAARRPAFFADWTVPDTPLGRFEMIALHMVLVLERLRGEPGGLAVGQGLTDDFFIDVEHSLRELGIGDLGVPKRMKKLAKMFYGRAESYAGALRAGDAAALAAALARNVRPDEAAPWPGATPLSAHVMRVHQDLAAQPTADLLAGRIGFPEPADAS